MSFNLYPVLTEKDKAILHNYIYKYGVAEEHFVGLEKWLHDWSYNKVKLYKLLGDQLIYSEPFSYTEPEGQIQDAFDNVLWESEHTSFIQDVRSCIWETSSPKQIKDDLAYELTTARSYARNELKENIILDYLPDKKKVVLSKGMKPIKALYKFLKYIDFEDMDKYESFRLEHSRVLNTREIKGELVISIHPMDFSTMSDNSYHWSSCMNWTEEEGGCYRVGTIEMMASNCVVCCYLKTKEPFYFDKGNQDEEHAWTNKKWRQLFYVTKDIIVGGKSYPYSSNELTLHLLSTLQELAKKNLGWEYSFGPEQYTDMKRVYSEIDFDVARAHAVQKELTQHRILFDVRGMYNDMANDHHREYLCVRNKVKHNKIINISGKGPCLCCGGEVAEPVDYYDEYNDKYENCNSLICIYCKEKKFTCHGCNFSYMRKPLIEFNGHFYCEDCMSSIKKCPSNNGEIIDISEILSTGYIAHNRLVFVYKPAESYVMDSIIRAKNKYSEYHGEELLNRFGFAPLFMSEKQLNAMLDSGEVVRASSVIEVGPRQSYLFSWERDYDYYVVKEPISLDNKNLTKYFYENLEDVKHQEAKN